MAKSKPEILVIIFILGALISFTVAGFLISKITGLIVIGLIFFALAWASHEVIKDEIKRKENAKNR